MGRWTSGSTDGMAEMLRQKRGGSGGQNETVEMFLLRSTKSDGSDIESGKEFQNVGRR